MRRECTERRFADNLAGTNFESLLSYGPIDVVYTWVRSAGLRSSAEMTKGANMYKTHHVIPSGSTGVLPFQVTSPNSYLNAPCFILPSFLVCR
jgi:hypothetical protein